MSAWLYMMSNWRNGILYVGSTVNLARRVWGHREGVIDGFNKKYGLARLVYVERHATILLARQHEMNMKQRPRQWKVQLIHKDNPDWDDLYDQVI